MGIKHAFTSAKSDGADPTLVQPSNWNADHTVPNNYITYTMMQQISANNRILGNNSGGAGNVAELTISQLLDMASASNGALLTRTGGAWAAMANVASDNGDLLVNANASPVAPGDATHLKSYVAQYANRPMLTTMAQSGIRHPHQHHFGMKKTSRFNPRFGSATTDFEGITWNTLGTAQTRQTATTSFATTLNRGGTLSSATAGSACGYYVTGLNGPVLRGSSSYMGGFHFICRFMISDASLVTTANMFVGLQSTNAAPTDVQPETLTNIFGIGCTNGDTVLQLYDAGSAAQSRTSLGANFPCNTVTTDMYEVQLWAPPSGSGINYMITRYNGGGTGDLSTASGFINTGANLPSTTTFLYPRAWRSNGGTATAVAIDVLSIYLETDF